MIISNDINKLRYINPVFKQNIPYRYDCRIYDACKGENIIKPAENHQEKFMKYVRPDCREIAERLAKLPTYSEHILPFATDLKRSELNYLYTLASRKDMDGEIRIPGRSFHYFSKISEERLRILEPLMLSQNDIGLWNYSPDFILQLDKNYSDYEINVMSRLVECNVHGDNLRQIATNPNLNHEKTIEKAQALKKLFGKKLREIGFYSNRNGEKFLYADIQLPHSDNKPDYLNFRRLYSILDEDVNPIAKKTNLTELDTYINNTYKCFKERMCIFSEKDLEKCIEDVKSQVSVAKESEILRTMQKLTQFAEYTSLQKIAKEMNHELHPAGGINPIFYYLSKKKFLFDLPVSDDGIKSSFVTKEDLHSKKFNNLLKRAKSSNIEWINLEGWSDGINLFTDNKTLTDKTVKILKRAKKLQAKNEQYTFNDALSIVLNKEIISGMKNYGYNVKTISLDVPATRDVILSQMQPPMPTQSLMKSTIASISSYYTKSESSNKFKKLCKRIADYYQANLQVYSKQRILENLKILNIMINQYARKNGVSSENIFYTLPNVFDSEYKSCELITKMYSNLFKIPEEQIIKINSFKDVNRYPENSIFVILDDIVGSGGSMTEFGDYRHCSLSIDIDKHILFCPISSTQKGLNYVNETINRFNRGSVDSVLSIDSNTVRKNNIATQFVLDEKSPKLNTKVLEATGHCNAALCHVFPYMGPDNDSALASYITKFFVPNSRCLKNKSKLLRIIEENAYYYDIFGTDKKHILTNAKRVYSPRNINRFVLVVKKIFNKLNCNTLFNTIKIRI